MKKKIVLLSLLLFVFYSCVQPQSSLPTYNEALSIEEQKIQKRLFAQSWLNTYIRFSEIGHGILFNASSLCKNDDLIYDIGLDVATKYDGPEFIREELVEELNLNNNLKVVSVAMNSPASHAGFKQGDEIIKINDLSKFNGEKAALSYYEELNKTYSSNYDFEILRNGTQLLLNVSTSKRCKFNYMIDLDNNTFNAFADGENMIFSLRMSKWLLQDEIGAAIVFSHELSHNANHHIEDKKTNAGIGAGIGLLAGILLGGTVGQAQDMMEIGADIGASQYSVDYENEADYVSLYALALSGYNIDNAVNFWRSFAVEVPNSIYSEGGSHPSTSERFVRMESTINEIKSKISKGEKLVPSYK